MPPSSPESRAPAGRPWLVAGLVACVWLGYVLSLQLRNPRLFPSWHGFLHSAIALQCGGPGGIPANPFFAGEPLHYYWVYHCIGRGVSSLLGLNQLVGLWLLSLAGLILLVAVAVWLGHRRLGTAWAGALMATFAIAGADPLGPVIALAKHLIRGTALFTPTPTGVETTFVSNQLADHLMSRPLLPALYLSADWRTGQNVAWFFDISSRGLALGVLMALLVVWVGAREGRGRLAWLVLLSGLGVALNPIVGLAVAGLLGASAVGLALLQRRELRPALVGAVALGLGVVLAIPTLLQLFGLGGTTELTPPIRWPVKLLVAGANLALLAPLAALGAARARRAGLERMVPVALAGLVLVALYATVHLEEGNEHNLLDAAYVLLALPAVIPLLWGRDGRPLGGGAAARRMSLAALAMVPMTAATWLAFDGRPPLPLDFRGSTLRRLPADAPVARLEAWLRDSTPPDAVLIADPDRPLKMSGNVSELPALTRRALYVDQPSYLTRPYPDVHAREELSRRAVAGDSLVPAQWAMLQRLRRPVYLLSWNADDAARRDRLADRYGRPAFADGAVAAWALRPSAALR